MKKVYKLGSTYIDIDKVVTITEPNINEEDGYRIKSCSIIINGQEYVCDNYRTVPAPFDMVTDKTQKEYQQFKKEMLKLFKAFISNS